MGCWGGKSSQQVGWFGAFSKQSSYPNIVEACKICKKRRRKKRKKGEKRRKKGKKKEGKRKKRRKEKKKKYGRRPPKKEAKVLLEPMIEQCFPAAQQLYMQFGVPWGGGTLWSII